MPLLLLTLLAFAASFVGGIVLARKRPKAAMIAVCVGIALIFLRILGRLYPQGEYVLLPFDWYVDVRPWWVFAPALFAIGVGAAKMSTGKARAGVAVIGALLWVAAAQRLWLTYMLPQDDMTGTADRNGVVRQTTDYTCGAAAAATVVTKLGHPATEREMADPCGTNALMGTDEFGVARGIRRKLAGDNIRIEVKGGDWEALRKAPLPAAVTVRYVPWIDHWVVVLESDEVSVVVGDPVNGRKRWTKDDFLSKWRKVMVTVQKGPETKNEK